MNIESSFPLNDVIKYASDFAKRKSPKASKILDIIIDKKFRPYLNLCFTYLRWVDDFIDNPSNSIFEKEKFIRKELKNFSLIEENLFLPDSLEEAALFYISNFSSSTKIQLIKEIERMVNALFMDVERLKCQGIFSEKDLKNYIDIMAKSLFNILFLFFNLHKNAEIFIGKFTANAQMIRDFDEDFKTGFINISREEIEFYKIDLKSYPNDPNLKNYLKSRIKRITGILDEELCLAKKLPIKFKIFTYYSFIYYLTWIERAEAYDYSPEKFHDKYFSKEIKIYFKTIIKSLEIFKKMFLYPSDKKR